MWFIRLGGIIFILLTACWRDPDPASKHSTKPVWHIPVVVYTVLDYL